MLEGKEIYLAEAGYPLKDYAGIEVKDFKKETNGHSWRVKDRCKGQFGDNYKYGVKCVLLDHDKAEEIGWVKPEWFGKKVEPSELGEKSYEIFKQAIENIASDIFTGAKAPIKESPLTKQVGGNHYQGFAIAPIDFVQKNNLGFIEGNIIKYVCRFRKKNGKQDLEKAKHFIEMLIELEYPENK